MAISKYDLPMARVEDLKKIQIDLDWTAGDYQKLLTASDLNFDRLLLSILREHSSDDIYNVTRVDFNYLVLLSRISTFGSKINVKWTHNEGCGAQNTLEFDLVNFPVKNCDIGPETFKFSNYTCDIKPPTIQEEISLSDAFTDKGLKFDDVDIIGNPLVLEYANARIFSFLKPRGKNIEWEEWAKICLSKMPAQVYKQLLAKITQYDSFGVQFTPIKAKCEKCGQETEFKLPFRVAIFSDI